MTAFYWEHSHRMQPIKALRSPSATPAVPANRFSAKVSCSRARDNPQIKFGISLSLSLCHTSHSHIKQPD